MRTVCGSEFQTDGDEGRRFFGASVYSCDCVVTVLLAVFLGAVVSLRTRRHVDEDQLADAGQNRRRPV